MFNKYYSIFQSNFRLLVVFVLFLGFTSATKPSSYLNTVVIDAGHGGKDPGCHGHFSNEKNVTLSIALKLGNLIKENFPGVKVVYTRDKDVFVELHERANIANKHKADLFISIHCNANPKNTVYGLETYTLGLHRTADNLEVSKRENSAVLLESDYKANYEGFDPNSPEASIIFTLYQNAFLEQSINFASKIQEIGKKEYNRTDRGVRQAGFLVLVKTAMPSVLIETGFLTNADEELIIGKLNGQEDMAMNIFKAFKLFKNEMEGVKNNTDEIKIPEKTKEEVKEFKEIEKNNPKTETETLKTEVKEEKKPDSTPKTSKSENSVVYKVQFYNSPKKIPLNSTKFAELSNVSEYMHQGSYKYCAGELKEFNAAMQLQSEMRKKGHTDCFVVAFNNGARIDINEAKKITNTK